MRKPSIEFKCISDENFSKFSFLLVMLSEAEMECDGKMDNSYKTEWTMDTNSGTYKDALKIRHDVFVTEQGVSVEDEIDELEDQTIHVVLYAEHDPIATARIYDLGNGTYKVQRVAVQKKVRKQGYGAFLMTEVEKKVAELGGRKITLGAQNTAIPFYERIAYDVEGDEFMDAGIPHHTMTKLI